MQFAAVGGAQVEFVASETHRHWIAGLPFTRYITIGSLGFILPGVNHSLDVNDDGADRGGGRLAKDFGFCLIPVFSVLATDPPLRW